MSSQKRGDLEIPFELNPPGQDMPTDPHDQIAGGIIIVAASATHDDVKMPALVFRFAKPDGSGFYPSITLVLDERQMLDLKLLTYQAVNASVKAAR